MECPDWAGVSLLPNAPSNFIVVARAGYKDVTLFDRDFAVTTYHTVSTPQRGQLHLARHNRPGGEWRCRPVRRATRPQIRDEETNRIASQRVVTLSRIIILRISRAVTFRGRSRTDGSCRRRSCRADVARAMVGCDAVGLCGAVSLPCEPRVRVCQRRRQ